MSERILLVDDEPNVLSSLKRQLMRNYEISTAGGGPEGLELIKTEGPFAVVVSDMRMPQMDGAVFLEQVKIRAPQTVRVMLTGNADQQTAVKAINEGNIFRFFNKPCPAEDLAKGLDAALAQYRLVTAEKNLLEKTLAGSVKVFAEVLNLIDPESFGKAKCRSKWATMIARHLDLPYAWQLTIAASLAELGNIAVPQSVITKRRRGYRPSPEEEIMISESPSVAKKLLGNVPRLGEVSDIIYYQNRGFDGSGYPSDGPSGEQLPIGARILKILNDVLATETGTAPTAETFEHLAKRGHLYDPVLFAEIQKLLLKAPAAVQAVGAGQVRDISVSVLTPGMRAATDISTKKGKLVLAAGEEFTPAQIVILRNLQSIKEIDTTVKILAAPAKQ